jgi:hypothetical protein
MRTDNYCFYLQNRLIHTSQTGGQRYSDTSPFSIPCLNHKAVPVLLMHSMRKGTLFEDECLVYVYFLSVSARIPAERPCVTNY